MDLSGNDLGPEGAKAIAPAIRDSRSLTECSVRGNQLNVESAMALAKVATERRVMLFGITHDQIEADLQGKDLKAPDAVLIANDISVSHSLSSIDISKNMLGDEGKSAIAKAIARSALQSFKCDALNLRSDAASLDLSGKKLGAGDAELVAAAMTKFMGSLMQVVSHDFEPTYLHSPCGLPLRVPVIWT